MDESYLEWLSSIPGSDAERARRIAARFSTYDELRAATREQLASVEGLTPSFVDALLILLGGSPNRDATEHLFLCPECGSFVGTGATACPFCGVQFEGSTGAGLAAELDDFLREDVPTRICQACGATMDKDATACIVCGRQYSPAELALLPTLAPILDESGPFCSRCGAYLFSDEPECAICGTSVTATPEVATGGKGVVKDFLSRWQRMAPPSATTSEADRLAEELEHYDRLLEANPSLERAWANRAKVLDKLGRTKEAAESLAKAAELNPAREDRYRLEVQNILRSTEDASVVAPRWTQPAATTAPKVVDVHLVEALNHYESLLRADPTLIVAWKTKAELLERLGRPEDARASRGEADRLERVGERSIRAAVTGLHSNGLATPGPTGAGRTNGRVNGTRSGRTNGRTNGRVNGLAEGRVNGLTTGAVNGLTFGRGATNGLVNGNGFTNGRRGRQGTPRIPSQPHWSRSVIGIAAVVALMIIVPILASILSPGPNAPSSIIRIDGDFSDWANMASYGQSAADVTPNPAVHLVTMKVATQDQNLFVYTRVQGNMFQGTAVNETDSIFVFVDEDNNRNTGYPIGDLGADSLVEVYGWHDLADIRHGISSFVFNETGQLRSNDWHRFLPGGSSDAAFAGQELEIRASLSEPTKARVLVYAADNLGNFDPADGSIRPSRATVIVGQQTIAKDIVASSQAVMLRVTLAPMGGIPHVSGLNITRRGTSVDPTDLVLYRDDGSGAFDANDTRLSNATMVRNVVRVPMNENLSVPSLYWVEAQWSNQTPTTTFGIAVTDVAGNGTASFRAGENGLVYLGAAPTSVRVDGAFGDWQGRPYGQDLLGDVTNRTGSLAYDANVDLLATAVDLGANFTGFVRVDGRMLGGQDIPTARVRTYPAPPTNNTTIPSIVPPQEGVDVMYAYIDADNSSATGLRVDVAGRAYGFDDAIAAVGRNGDVNSTGLYGFVAGQSNPWNLLRPIDIALDAHRMEFGVNASAINLTAGYRVVFYASDWRLEYDLALPDAAVARFPVSIQAATNVVINEVSPQPNPEWIEVANPLSGFVSLNGWTLALVRGNKDTVIFTFTTQVLGAFGSGSEYLRVALFGSSLPNGASTVRLRQGATIIDETTYSQNVNAGTTWARFKDPATGVPTDTNNDAVDFYVSILPSPGQANDRHGPTIVVAKTASRAIAGPGDAITYTLYYNNTNTGNARTVWINDTLPSGVLFSSSSVAPSSFSGQTYHWIFGNVGPGAHSFSVTAQVTSATTDGQVLRNTATLAYVDTLRRPMPGSTGWANTTVRRPMITVVKTATPSSAKPGDSVTFTIYYNNTGTVAAGTVTIKDSLPSGMTFQSATPPPTWNDGRTFFWNMSNVAPGSHSLTMTALVDATFSGSQLVNWAFLNYTTPGGFALNGGQSSAIVAIPELSDMIYVALVPLVIVGLKWRAQRRERE